MLVAESDLHRRTFLLQVAEMEHSVAQLKKKFAILGISSVALSAGASIAGLLFARRKPGVGGEKGGGWFSKISSGISLFNHIKGIFARVKSSFQGAEGEDRS